MERNEIILNSLNLNHLYLQNGTVATLRAARAGDVDLLADMYLRVSPASLFNRYFRPYTPTLADLERLCHIGANEGAVYVATIDAPCESIIGYGFYVIAKSACSCTAEPAFLVEDRFQGQGLGRTIFQHLAQHAFARGVCAFDAYVHPANAQMMRVFHGSGLPVSERISYGTREVRIALAAAPVLH